MMMDSLFNFFAVASVISVGLLFLPAIIELKKPSYSGPRLIDSLFEQRFSSAKKLWSTSKTNQKWNIHRALKKRHVALRMRKPNFI
jgi:hypothetical protein